MKKFSFRESTVARLRELETASPPRAIGVLDAGDLQVMYDRRAALGELADKESASDAEVRARAEQAGKTSRTLWTWLRAYRAHGLAGLAPKRRADAGAYHNISDEVVDLVRGIRLSNKDWPVRAVYELAIEMAAKLGISAPSRRQVRRICKEISPVVKLLADKRDKQFRNGFRFTYPQQHNGVKYQIDHNFVDVLVRDLRDPKYCATREEVRPWLTLVIDAASRHVIAYTFSYDPPYRHTTAGVIRKALLASPGGIPQEIWMDNGKDLVASHVSQLIEAYDIELHVCQPHEPQERGIIERFFKTLNTRLWSKLPGYVSSNVTERNPSARAELTMDDLKRELESFLEVYHAEVHESLGMSPNEYWEQNCFALPVTAIRELDSLLLEEDVRKVLKVGIKFGGRTYWHRDLATIVSRQVRIRADTRYEPPDEIEVFFDDRWLCTAFAQDSKRGLAVSRSEIAEAKRSQKEAAQVEISDAQMHLKEAEEKIAKSQEAPNSGAISETDTSADATPPPADSLDLPQQSKPRVVGPTRKPGDDFLDMVYRKTVVDGDE